jgi:hypothetical protein
VSKADSLGTVSHHKMKKGLEAGDGDLHSNVCILNELYTEKRLK